MGWFKKLFSARRDPNDPYGYWIFARCDRCAEKLATRINLQNDLSIRYENRDPIYFVRKILVGNTGCFQRVEINMTFDNRRILTERQIKGGEFITREEYNEEQEDDEQIDE